MQVFSLVLPLLLFRGISVTGDVVFPDDLTYTTPADGYYQLELPDFERNLWNELLFLWTPDSEGQSSDEMLVVMSRKILSKAEFLESLDAWKARRHEFKYLRLSCLSESAGKSESACMCSSYVRSSNRTNGRTTVSSTSERSRDWDWVRTSVSRCPSLPRLGRDDFRDFVNVAVLDFDHVRFGVVERDAFRQLSSIQVVRFSNISMSVDDVSPGILCGMSTLRSVEIVGVRGTSSTSIAAIVRLLSCDVDRSNSSGGREGVQTGRLDIRNVSMHGSQLNGTVFADLSRQVVRSVNLSWNSIRTIDGETFLGFRNAVELDVSGNLIARLDPPVFSELLNLEFLNLEFNRLESVDTVVFDDLASLRILNLAGNRIFHVSGGFSVLPNLAQLYLGGNRLSVVNERIFSNCSRLERLWLGENEIADVHEDALKGTVVLRILDLSNNRLSNETGFRNVFQQPLVNLTNLRLGNNNLTRLLPSMFRPINATYRSILLAIDVSSNQLDYIDQDAFLHHENLWVLAVQHNKLTSLHPDTFKTNNKLFFLCIAYNFLESIPPLPDSVEKLFVNYNLIKRLPLFNRTMPNLRDLVLEGNKRLTSIGSDSFAAFPRLTVLLIRDCSLSRIADDAFRSNPDLRSADFSMNNLDLDFSVDYFGGSVGDLYSLNFSHNNIKSAQNLFLHQKIRSAVTIDLSHNPIRTFPDQPSDAFAISTIRLVMVNCSLDAVSEFSLVQASSMAVLDLTSNRLKEFRPLQIRDRLDDAPFQVILGDNPVECSCRMRWLTDAEYSRHYRVPYCYESISRTLVPINSLSKDEFLCRVTEYCTVEYPQCDCYAESVAGLPTHLDCSGKGIRVFPRNLPPSMRVVHFKGNSLESFTRRTASKKMDRVEMLFLCNNRISEIEPLSFEMFPNLLLLDLSGNRLRHLKNGAFAKLRRLAGLYLHGNLIQELSGSLLNDLHLLNVLTLHNNSLSLLTVETMQSVSSLAYLSNLTLHDNPWSCHCDNATFKYWIQLHADLIHSISNVVCNNTPILTISDEALLCYDPFKTILLSQYHPELLLTVCILSVLIILVLVLVYRQRYVLQVLIFSKFHLRRRQKEDERAVHDAIAIYDGSDGAVRRWVKDVLLQRLEPRFRLYIPDRDMLPGSVQSSEIVETIGLSRRTLVVLSPGAEAKREVLFALEAANDRTRVEGCRHRVYLVLLDTVTRKGLLGDSGLNETLKAYLKAGQYLCTAGRLFWDELVFFMPRSVAGQEGSRRLDYNATREESVPLTLK